MIITAHRWEGGWEIRLSGDPITQVSTLDKAADQVRDYLDTVTPEIDHSDWTIEIHPDLGELGDKVAQARTATEAAALASMTAAAQSRETVRQLREAGISVTDSAAILGVSRGRISQLVKA